MMEKIFLMCLIVFVSLQNLCSQDFECIKNETGNWRFVSRPVKGGSAGQTWKNLQLMLQNGTWVDVEAQKLHDIFVKVRTNQNTTPQQKLIIEQLFGRTINSSTQNDFNSFALYMENKIEDHIQNNRGRLLSDKNIESFFNNFKASNMAQIVATPLPHSSCVPSVSATNQNGTYKLDHVKLKVLGRAIVIDLQSVAHQLNSSKSDTHMTVMFYGSSQEAQNHLQEAIQAFSEWKRNRPSSAQGVTFDITPWGNKSSYIKGELEDLGNFIRSKLPNAATQQRPLHVELY